MSVHSSKLEKSNREKIWAENLLVENVEEGFDALGLQGLFGESIHRGGTRGQFETMHHNNRNPEEASNSLNFVLVIEGMFIQTFLVLVYHHRSTTHPWTPAF